MTSFAVRLILGMGSVICWAIYLNNQKEKRRKQYAKYQQEEDQHTRKMCAAIKKLANDEMKPCEFSNGIPFRRVTIIEYDKLLRIWDLADKVKERI